MRPRARHLAPLAFAAALPLLFGCSSAPQSSLAVREVTPAFLDTVSAFDPAVAADPHGRLALTYVTRADSGRKDLWLAVSSDSGASFGAPVRVNARAGGVVSFSEGRPVPLFGPSGSMVVVWMERREGVAGAVDLAARGSGDGGATLGAVAWINDDRAARAAFHGFPAVAYLGDGSLFATWLDERDLPASDEEPVWSSLYSAVSVDGGQTWSPNRAVRDTVCPCCRPAAAAGAQGAVAIGFRAANGDLRDPALAVSRDGGATFALDTLISADGWRLSMCPDVGPALLWNRADGGAYAWLTEAGEPGVYLVPWRAASGAAGVKRKLGDGVLRATHPRLADFGNASVLAVEGRTASDTTRTVLAVRVLEPSGALGAWTFLGGDVRAGWLAGAGSAAAFACWTETEPDRSRLRLVRLARPQ